MHTVCPHTWHLQQPSTVPNQRHARLVAGSCDLMCSVVEYGAAVQKLFCEACIKTVIRGLESDAMEGY